MRIPKYHFLKMPYGTFLYTCNLSWEAGLDCPYCKRDVDASTTDATLREAEASEKEISDERDTSQHTETN